ncbi:flippase [Paucilactobacillus nenjiangensis]|uniref:Flippase n=1 Tax=Paucilactobacillus nenjiangensis TaxID=1296540 RepID=A0A5P1X393_9LACO|nr:flippase [Paucilactobacillus nenjiangensis]QER67139.1 flippase [Paucilactobacillus nenjiangensis]
MKVIKNYLYNAGYQVLILLTPLITVPYVARVLGAAGSGINSYTNSWVQIFYMLGQLGITLYGNREIAYHRDDVHERSRIFLGIEILQLISIGCTLIVYIFATIFFSTTFQTYFFLQILWLIAAGLDVSWFFMGMEDFKKTVERNTIVKFVSIALIFILVKQESDLGKYIILLGLSQFVGNLTLWPYLKKMIIKVPWRELKPWKHLYPSIILFIPTISTQIYLVVNRLMLGSMGPSEALGQFDYADKLVKLILAIVTASGTVMLPHVANKFAKGDVYGIRRGLYNSFDFVTALAVPLMFGLMAISFKFAPWFLGDQYIPTGKIMFIEAPVILLIAWSNVTGTQYLMPVNRIKEYTISVTVGSVVNIVLNIFLIEVFSANGAALATVISEFVVTAVQVMFIRTTIKRRTLFKDTWRYGVSGIVMFFVVYRISMTINMTLPNLILQIFAGVFVYFVALVITKAPIIDSAQELLTGLKNRNK